MRAEAAWARPPTAVSQAQGADKTEGVLRAGIGREATQREWGGGGCLRLNCRRGGLGGPHRDRISLLRGQQKAAMLWFRAKGPVENVNLMHF